MEKTLKLILERLDALFRYFLPGVIVLYATYLSRPSCFDMFGTFVTFTLLSLCGLSLVVGFMVYALHRFTIHQGLDYICWKWLNKKGEAYRNALTEAVEKGVPEKKRNDHILVRSSQLIFLFIAIEAFGLFTLLPPESDSILATHSPLRWALLALAFVVCGFAIWQYSLVNHLDRTLDRGTGEDKENAGGA